MHAGDTHEKQIRMNIVDAFNSGRADRDDGVFIQTTANQDHLYARMVDQPQCNTRAVRHHGYPQIWRQEGNKF
ncbi:Uncharacterised protein [Enterobacter cloacae]|nr:Uncharacterised protein [Enterobacter cloacae]